MNLGKSLTTLLWANFFGLFLHALQNHINPAMDFTQTPPGMLALDNMLYLAKFHQDTYIRVSEAAVLCK